MLFSPWFRPVRPVAIFRPNIDLLEERVVPTAFRTLPPPVPTPPPATQFRVIVPQHVEAGKAFSVIVQAEDAHHKVTTNFKGTVQIKLTTTDTGAKLPASFTFSARDLGRHTFQVTLAATGAQTVKAASGGLAGNAPIIVDGSVTHFGVYALGQAMTGSPTVFNVVALDANNSPVAGYVGTVHFSSTDFYAAGPADYTFSAADAGSHLFQVSFANAGLQSVAATDTITGSKFGVTQVQVFWLWYNPAYTTNWGWNNWWW
jgi:hypothetical protein